MDRFDVVVIGAGIAGASAAARIAAARHVCLLEREARPGTQATGRSATMFALAYGDRATRRLAAASRAFLTDPDRPDGPLASPRGMLHVASPGQEAALRTLAEETGLPVLSAAEVIGRLPVLRPERVAGGVLDAAADAIDDHRFLQCCLRDLKAAGGELRCGAEVTAIAAEGAGFRLETSAGPIVAGWIVNAAGAWADQVAQLAGLAPLGLCALRRTALTIDPPDGQDPSRWPMAIDVAEQWYFKPEGGRLLLSPGDAAEVAPQDVQPEEWDVAVAIDRYTGLTGHEPRRIHASWAGLRSFVPDHAPVAGADPGHPRFVWLAGQGGAGFMTAPAMAEIACAAVGGGALSDELAALLPDLSPARLMAS
ncbi:NAD(P)/FAD-dependent oxidoreductase [Geminicoccus roseus]|uniref:NAD(P)/FAD-dependent oxidoreductase n=1 Tax=Geminicoccus roseus TaxID=404900 RepID=UPI0003FE8149|nr:FAD-dependent oxidoreductase [Geminicoccus roseus]